MDPPFPGAIKLEVAGREGFEPTTRGFGIRCSTVGATALQTCLLAFFVVRVLAAELAELLELKLVGGLLLVLGGSVVLTLADGAVEIDDDAHGTSLRRRG
jgi:hypothetical protein